MKTCKNCKYFTTCGDANRNTPCAGRKEKLTAGQAKAFYRDLCGTVYGNADKNCGGIMSVELIADHMKISVTKATEFCDAMIEYGITEKSCGMIVV